MPGYTKLDPPIRGLHEDGSFEDQPPETTQECDDARAIDSETGRRRISQREGLSPFTTSAVSGTEKIDAGIVVSVSENQIVYSELEITETLEEWGQVTPTGRTCSALQVDRQGNTLAIDGLSGLVKYNSEGRETLTFNFPVEDESAEIRAFRVDSFDQIYVGVSTGGEQKDARLYSYRPDEDDKYELRWEIDTGDFIEDCALNDKETLLYTIQNNVKRHEAFLRVYANIGSTVPTLSWERQIPFPCNALAVKPDGSALVACEAFADRGKAANGDGTVITEDWTPNDLDDFEARIFAWLDAKDLSALYTDGDEIVFWPDKSGNSRSMTASPGTAPTFVESAFAGLPAVHFDGVDDRMISQAPYSTASVAQSGQRNLLPGSTGSGWALFMAVRPSVVGPTNVECIISQSVTPLGARYFNMWSNATGSASVPPAASAGGIWPRLQGATLGAGFAGQSDIGDFDNVSQVAIISIVVDNVGGVDTMITRVNGDPVDILTGPAVTSLDATSFGRDTSSSPALSFYDGDILECITVRDFDPGTGRVIIEGPGYPDAPFDPASDTEVERFEGYLAHRWAVADELDDGEPTFPHPFELANGAPTNSEVSPSVFAQLNNVNNLVAKFGPTRGDPKWVIANDSDNPNATGATGVGGLGYGVAVNSQGDVYTVGPGDANDEGGFLFSVRKILDTGDSFDIEGVSGSTGPWRALIPTSGVFLYKFMRLAVDTFDNLYTPLPADSTSGYAMLFSRASNDANVDVSLAIRDGAPDADRQGRAVAVFPDPPEYEEDTVERAEFIAIGIANSGGLAATGFIYIVTQPTAGDLITVSDGQGNTDIYEWDTSAEPGSITVVIGGTTAISAANLQAAFGVLGSGTVEITATTITAAGGDVDDGVSLLSDNVGFRENQPLQKTEAVAGEVELRGMTSGSDADDLADTVRKFKLVDTEEDIGSSRNLHVIVASNGALADVTAGGAPVILDANALSTLSTHISFTTLFEKVYVTDGQSRVIKVLDFRPSTPTVEDFESEDGGTPPARCAFLSSWRERLVFLRPADDPHQWHMSEAGNPLNNDLEPPVVTPASAISGNQKERAGLCPDIINGFIPYSDDTAIFGCDHSLYLLRGDPQAGGQFDRISDVIGMAFGNPWAKDPEGVIYLFTTQGGIVSMLPNGTFYRLSQRRIERRLQDVDLSTSRIQLVWDFTREGLLVLQTKMVGDGRVALLDSWFWDKKHDFWARDRRGVQGTTDVQPSSGFVLDGDEPGDRTVLFGCEDGLVRRVDGLAKDDDGVAIGSSVLFGPYQFGGEYEMKLHRLSGILANEQDGVRYEVFDTDNPESLGKVKRAGSFGPGRNPTKSTKVRGAYVYIRLSNFAPDQRWSLERLAGQFTPSGRRRVRS